MSGMCLDLKEVKSMSSNGLRFKQNSLAPVQFYYAHKQQQLLK